MTEKNKVYFANLNCLRFFASFFIIFQHVQIAQTRLLNQKPNFSSSFCWLACYISLSSLFTISGFLITYIILKEKKHTSTVNIGKFYVRRILRIWPLYYTVVILIYFVFPRFSVINHFYITSQIADTLGENFFISLFFALIILPVAAIRYAPEMIGIGPAWTLSIEESFYLIWPWVIKKAKNTTRTLYILIGAISLLAILFLIVKFYFYRDVIIPPNILSRMHEALVICLLIGALGGSYLSENKKILLTIFKKNNQILLYLLFFVSFLINWMYNRTHSYIIVYEFYSILLTCILLNLAANKESILKIENKVLDYLGKISYGLYLYNVLVILVICAYFKNINGWIFLIATYFFTIIISIISYEVVEKRFLRAKVKYSVILSGDNAIKQ